MPLESATTVTGVVAPSINRLTLAPGSAVPLRVGVLSLVLPSPSTPVSEAGSSTSVGAVGAAVSIVTASAAVAMLSVPPLVMVEL